MATPLVAELQLGTATIIVRHVPQRRRNEISRDSLTRTGETDWEKQSALMAKEVIGGWEDLTPLDALSWGYDDYESLPTDDNGKVPYTEATAVKLYADCLISQFRNPIDDCSLTIAREVAQAKKRAAA